MEMPPFAETTVLSPDEIARYKRHLLVKEIGGQGQQRLKAARVLVVGAGGLGSPLIMYLAAAGVGTIGIIDDDRVSIDNLQRQAIYTTADAGALKAERAAAFCRSLNPHVTAEAMPFRLTAENALEIVSRYDIAADGSDNFATRYLVNDACYFAGSRWFLARWASSTVMCPHSGLTRLTSLASRCRTTAAFFQRRRPQEPLPVARRRACSAPSRASSARFKRLKS